MSKQLRAGLMLTLTALIWGAAFVAQSVGMDYVGPFTYLCSRSVIAGIVLLPLIKSTSKNEKPGQFDRSTLIKGGIACGIALFAASILQHRGQGRLHNITLYDNSAYHRYFPRQKSSQKGLVLCRCCCHRYVSALYERRRGNRQGRPAGAFVCSGLCLPYTYNRPFLAYGQRHKNELYSVLDNSRHFRSTYVFDRKAFHEQYNCRLGPYSLCRHSLLRRRLYTSDSCPEGY